MISYSIICDAGHRFDSWFKSATAFDALRDKGHVNCPNCGSAKVKKAVMAPHVSQGSEPARREEIAAAKTPGEQAIAALRKHVQENADYVGANFADEARSMYLGVAPERAIYGEANPAEAKALIEDGIPVAPLPFLPTRKAN